MEINEDMKELPITNFKIWKAIPKNFRNWKTMLKIKLKKQEECFRMKKEEYNMIEWKNTGIAENRRTLPISWLNWPNAEHNMKQINKQTKGKDRTSKTNSKKISTYNKCYKIKKITLNNPILLFTK